MPADVGKMHITDIVPYQLIPKYHCDELLRFFWKQPKV